MPPKDWRFYFITDSGLTRRGIIADAGAAIKAGAKAIQYRDKTNNREVRLREANLLVAMCKENGADLIVNDDPELAKQVNADGFHLGPRDMPLHEAREIFDGIIGVSCNTVEEIEQAERDGADYIAAGPVFQTETKLNARTVLGPAGLAELRKATSLPIVAIGGINTENAKSVIEAGANTVCAIKASVDVDDVEKRVREFEEKFHR